MAPPFASTSKLPAPVEELIKGAQLIKQGAEAKVYKTTLYPTPTIYSPPPSSSSSPPSPSPSPIPVLLKHRFKKSYRHPTLDALLTRQRLTSEARALVRCYKAGVRVPGLRIVDVRQGVLGIEWVQGWSVREVLGGGQEDDELPGDEDGEEAEEEEEEDTQEKLRKLGVDEDALLSAIGGEIAKMHIADVIHGDLTTSNMMVLIDFGLSSTSIMQEDRAVDLYVLERAFSSTHPVPLLPSGEEGEPHFTRVLEGYKEVMVKCGKKGDWARVEKRLEDVRMRGRKRSMVG
ncbi:TP53 regulating kinase [Pseudohyphozyma bogoriensis]|nr:TP53 regulating kinase [Pseudohyphozyma bogoriensis]